VYDGKSGERLNCYAWLDVLTTTSIEVLRALNALLTLGSSYSKITRLRSSPYFIFMPVAGVRLLETRNSFYFQNLTESETKVHSSKPSLINLIPVNIRMNDDGSLNKEKNMHVARVFGKDTGLFMFSISQPQHVRKHGWGFRLA